MQRYIFIDMIDYIYLDYGIKFVLVYEMNKNTYTYRILYSESDHVCFQILENQELLSFFEVIDRWGNVEEFTSFYIQTINELGWEGIYWEHPPIRREWGNQPYQCWLKESKSLPNLKINDKAFEAKLKYSDWLADFYSLGKDARLVVPTKKTEKEHYGHLSSVLKKAPTEQKLKLFQRLAKVLKEELESGKTIWLNTSGLGVIWLHLRLDTRPKYKKNSEYRSLHFWDRK